MKQLKVQSSSKDSFSKRARKKAVEITPRNSHQSNEGLTRDAEKKSQIVKQQHVINQVMWIQKTSQVDWSYSGIFLQNSKHLGKELMGTKDVIEFVGDLFRKNICLPKKYWNLWSQIKQQPKLQIDQSRLIGEFHNRKDKGNWRVMGMRNTRSNLVTVEYDVVRLCKTNTSNGAPFPDKLSADDLLPKLLIYFPYPNPRPYFLQEKIQPTLEEVFRMTQFGVLNVGTTRDVIIGCVKALRLVHRIGYVHRCVTPYNFAVRLEASKMILQNDLCEQICLTDLTLARKYKDVKRPPRRVTAFIGTYKYSSISAHKHLEQLPKDDIISCLYMFCEFLQGFLPWRTLKNVEKIITMKRELQMKPPIFVNNNGGNRIAVDLSQLSGMFTLLEQTKS
uniref:Protein kinase domain-containing protein n=1 Tax=Setaria digitata TaxID=48799 RepID=A0A915Q6D7_9BILA